MKAVRSKVDIEKQRIALDFGSLSAEDEVILSALAPRELLFQIHASGATPVFADVDPRSGAITRATLEAAITTYTRVVVLSEVGAFLPAWSGLSPSTEPRDIRIVSVRSTPDAAQLAKKLVAGVEAIGGDLLRLDLGLILKSPAAFASDLRRAGAEARALGEVGFAFESEGLLRRYRRRDFPGAVAAVETLIALPGWDFHLPAIEAAAFAAYRQESFDFMQPLLVTAPVARPVPRPVFSEGIAASAPPATRLRASGSRR